MILLLLRNGSQVEVPECVDVVRRNGTLYCLDRWGIQLLCLPTLDVVSYTFNQQVAHELIEEQQGRHEPREREERMGLLDQLRGSSKKDTAVTEKPTCLHTALAPRWNELDDIGHADRISEYVCEGCGTRLSPAEASQLRVTSNELVGPSPGET